MKRSSIIMLIASAILVAGMLVAGCTQDSGSASSQTDASTASPTAGPVKTVGTVTAGNSGGVSASVTPDQSGTGDKPQFNQSAGQKGTPPEGMQINGTRPSGTPPDGMQMNGTRPSGGTPPTGTPPSGTQPSGTPPSGS